MRNILSTKLYLFTITAVLALASCGGSGGGGGDDEEDADNGPDYYYGFFLDDAVQGLIVETGAGPAQTTDENGAFRFLLGNPIAFRIDDLALGTIDSGLEIITPGSLTSPNLGNQVFRFIQSLDTTPGTPGIDLRGIDLPPTPINFSQSNSFFENDPAVIAALAAAQAAGASGVLVDYATAQANYLAATSRIFSQADFEDLVAFPVPAAGSGEPCLVFFHADLSGESICQDDILADPADAVESFTWSVVSDEVVANIGTDTRVTVTRNGTTGNRIHTRVTTECLTCNPNLGPAIEIEQTTFYTALPISAPDFSGQTFTLGGTVAAFNGNGTATFDDGLTTENANWSIDTATNLLLLQGTGAAGATDLMYVRAILIDGSVTDGRFAVLNARVTDTGNDGVADPVEFDTNGLLDSVEVLTSTP